MKLTASPVPVSQYIQRNDQGISLWWLGQAGILIKYGKTVFLLDAYLSDFLAEKYKGKKYPHERMMPPPIGMDELADIDYCLCSHSHSDHMDPGLFPVLGKTSPRCRYIIPEAVRGTARERGIPGDMIIGIEGGETISLQSDIRITAVPAAHEELNTDEEGRHCFLGYVLQMGDFAIYHSGDCIPYEGLDYFLSPFSLDLALLPVNGRSEELSRDGITGNFSFSESCHLTEKHDITYMMALHTGMFRFNTVGRDELMRQREESAIRQKILLPEIGNMYNLTRT